MSIRTLLLRVGLFCLVSFSSGALAAPAINDPNVTSSASWTVFGAGGNTGTVFNNSSPNVLGGLAHGFVQATGGTGSSGTGVAGLRTVLQGLNGGALGTAFNSQLNAFTSAARLTGSLQSFTTTVLGDVSFDLQRFVTKSDATFAGDPFAFIYNIDTDVGSFIRGGSLGTGNSTTAIPNFTVNGVTYTHGGTQSSVNFANLVAGNYVVGFGFGADGNASGNNEFGGLAVRNFQSPNGASAVPEIDTTAASLPLALVFLGIAVVYDRRRVAV